MSIVKESGSNQSGGKERRKLNLYFSVKEKSKLLSKPEKSRYENLSI